MTIVLLILAYVVGVVVASVVVESILEVLEEEGMTDEYERVREYRVPLALSSWLLVLYTVSMFLYYFVTGGKW